jgi:hypothetical protein
MYPLMISGSMSVLAIGQLSTEIRNVRNGSELSRQLWLASCHQLDDLLRG